MVYLALFQIALFQGWTEILEDATAIRSEVILKEKF